MSVKCPKCHYENPDHHCCIPWISVIPLFKLLRDDRRFHKLLNKMNVLPLE